MTRAVIVTTTINIPKLLVKWLPTMTTDDEFIIVGDLKSPHTAIGEFMTSLNVNAQYITPEAQGEWRVSEHLGWNTIARRNIGTLEAIMRKPEFIVMIDDDNYPEDPEYLNNVRSYLYHYGETYVSRSKSGFVDTCGSIYDEGWKHRGFPPSLRYEQPSRREHEFRKNTRVGVFESHWIGHPDMDAVDRITYNDRYEPSVGGLIVPDIGTWAPFNSQATSYHIDLAPLMFVWPHIGRADDIFGSYLARAVMDPLGWHAAHGDPFVVHERDSYGERTFASHLRDMKNELFCYEHTDDIIKILRENVPDTSILRGDSSDVTSLMNYFFGVLQAYAPWLPSNTFAAMDAWLEDISRATHGGTR